MNPEIVNVWYVAGILAIVQTVAAGMITFFIKRQFSKHDKRVVARKEAHDKAQQERDAAKFDQECLQLEIMMADAKLSYAIVAAIKRGSPNGEIEDALNDYKKAHERYNLFLKKQGIHKLEEKEHEGI